MKIYIKSPELIHCITGNLTFTPHPPPMIIPNLLSVSMNSVVFFLDSTCKCDHMIFVFLCLSYLA